MQSMPAMVRTLPRQDRRALYTALRRLSEGHPATAFAHDLSGAGRVVQHLQFDARTGRVHGLIERLGRIDAGAAVREAMAGVRDGPGIRRWLERRLADDRPVQVVRVALNRFDLVNTAYGRAAGDAVLRNAATRIGRAVRETPGKRPTLARMGGAEFLLAIDEAPGDAVEHMAEAVAQALGRPFVIGDAIVPMGARITTASSRPGDRVETLLIRASEAEGEAQDMRVPIDALAVDLRHAMDSGQIELRFQPQVAVTSGAVVGVEALARWRHPALGDIGAEPLFAAAERAGLIVALSEHVQRLALDSAARWPQALAGLRLAVNVTSEDVGRSNFVDLFLDWVDSSGFPRSRLTVEITEGGLIADIGEASRLLGELRAAGCRVAIDDFGTGYSSLAYLKSLPLDYLKIDRKLTQDIAGSVRDRVVVRGVIDMARSLGLAVVAEGVETTEQLELLAKEGCQFYQGFLCAQPLTIEDLTALLTQGEIPSRQQVVEALPLN